MEIKLAFLNGELEEEVLMQEHRFTLAASSQPRQRACIHMLKGRYNLVRI
jgi:hypothetical protein